MRIEMKTASAKPGEIERKWYVVDAEDEVLGRLASRVAMVLRGKMKPQFTPHVDTGDFVVIVNAEKVKVTGAKRTDKMYYRHTGYPGGIRGQSFERLISTYPERVIYHAVRGMLPKNKLGRKLIKKLKVYGGTDHPHTAQNPESLTLTK
jgi:large subunit ribosomal protein L13